MGDERWHAQPTFSFISSCMIAPSRDLCLPIAMDHIKQDSAFSSHHLLFPSSQHSPPHSFSFPIPTIPRVSLPMPSICLGSSDEDVDCECVAFVPRKSRKSRCKECNHSLASHSDPPATQSHEHIAVAATQRDHNKYVDRLAKSLKASATHEKARKETLQGFRPTPSASVSPLSLYSTTC